MKTVTSQAIDFISRRAMEKDISLQEAAIEFKIECRALARQVMEEIGSSPSSEPELAALQKVY